MLVDWIAGYLRWRVPRARHPTLTPNPKPLIPDQWLFDLGADLYAWFTASAAWRASAAELAARLHQPGVTRIVDLGCGPGVSTFELARQLPEATLVGLDIAPRMLNEARRRRQTEPSTHRITWIQADAAQLPFDDASLDACTGHSFLYLVADRRKVLKEIERVLKPGGHLVLMEPNERHVSIAQALSVSRDPRHLVSVSLWRPFSRLHGRFTPATLVATLERAGFENCDAGESFAGLALIAAARKKA